MTTVWKIVERILSSVTTNPVKCYFPTTRHLSSMCQKKPKCFYHYFISVWFCWQKKKKNNRQKGILMEGNRLHAFQKSLVMFLKLLPRKVSSVWLTNFTARNLPIKKTTTLLRVYCIAQGTLLNTQNWSVWEKNLKTEQIYAYV